MHSPMMERGCGRRKKGAIYSNCPLGEGGTPIEEFLIDPPQRLTLELAPQGVQIFEAEGVAHIIDWVGSSHYPNVADFVEEVRRMGMSRRLPKTLAFERLTLESRHFLVHSRAIVAHPEMYRREDAMPKDGHRCPKALAMHQAAVEPGTLRSPMCAGIWWEDLDPFGAFVEPDVPGSRVVTRKIPCGTYEGLCSPGDPKAREYVAGIFAGFPIWNLQVVRDPDGGSHNAAADAAARAGLEIEIVDE